MLRQASSYQKENNLEQTFKRELYSLEPIDLFRLNQGKLIKIFFSFILTLRGGIKEFVLHRDSSKLK